MIVLIIVLSVLLTAVLIGLIVPYYIVFYSPHRNADEIETEPFLDDMDMFNEIKAQARKLSEIPCSRVQTRAYDGVRLSGRYYHKSDDAPLCICFHGYRGSSVLHFSTMFSLLTSALISEAAATP